jgi:hypothetical protein
VKSWISALLIFIAASLLATALPASSRNSPEAAGLARKLGHIEANAKSRHPDQSPTTLTEQEVNAYLASDQIELPAGVESVKLQAEPGIINGTAHVNFDRVREGVHSSNPLLSVFSGVHEVAVFTHARGASGQGNVHVDSVSLDGIEVPNFVLELFVEKYLQPKYPQIGIDSRFTLPDRIDTATVGQHQITLTQK